MIANLNLSTLDKIKMMVEGQVQIFQLRVAQMPAQEQAEIDHYLISNGYYAKHRNRFVVVYSNRPE